MSELDVLNRIKNELGLVMTDVNTLIASHTVPTPPASTLVWQARFAAKNLSEVNAVGGFVKQGNGAWLAKYVGGKDCIELRIVTPPTGAAYLFVWRQMLLPLDEYVYSCSYFIPSGITIYDWWHIAQWKSTYDGNTNNSVRTVALGIQKNAAGKMVLYMSQRPTVDPNAVKQSWISTMEVQTNQWFTLLTYYKKAKDTTGAVTVWQDGVKVFDVPNIVTAFADNTLQWSVNSYTDKITPSPCSIYVTDMKIESV